MSCTDCVHYDPLTKHCILDLDGTQCKRFDRADRLYKERATGEIFQRTRGTYDNKEICDWCGKRRYGHQIKTPSLSQIWDICNGCLKDEFEEVGQ